MTETLLNQAKALGFVCNEDNQGNLHIFPQKTTERWKLRRVGDQWLLLVGDIPQVCLHPHEAISFLKRRRATLNH
ncbi:MAG: hypothetical protein LDL41_24260 [Coleofasciculus sp. S288]|nr:hypothetical protein [Coleofasciculus sp. S288]